jgi:hypothetical protein
MKGSWKQNDSIVVYVLSNTMQKFLGLFSFIMY